MQQNILEQLEEEPDETNTQSQPKKKSKAWFYFKALVFLGAITLAVYFATRPTVITFFQTLETYTSKSVQMKAWNEAKRQNLEREIKNKSEELENIKPLSFWMPEAKAQVLEEPKRQLLNIKMEAWLKTKDSPLAEYTDVLLQQPNWKRILSIAQAESSLCKRYPADTANCWGIGGEKLWDLGNNLREGIVAANDFIENYPKSSKKKYKDMTIEEMNGLYKQPYGAHWSINNYNAILEINRIELETK
jgi:hypothetical protein